MTTDKKMQHMYLKMSGIFENSEMKEIGLKF